MFDKLKLWLMSEENKQKYLMEKEKSERDNKRREKESSNKKEGKSKTKKEENSKGRNDNPKNRNRNSVKDNNKEGLFGKNKNNLNTDIDYEDENENLLEDEENIMEDKPKKVVVVKRKSDIDDIDDIDDSDDSVDREDDINFEAIDNLSKSFETKKDAPIITNADEEFKKKELLLKKKEEEYKYMSILLDLPPTTDENYFIKRAFEAGIPEWFLKSKGYMVDSFEIVKEETVKAKEEEVIVEKIKEELKSVIDENIDENILDNVMDEILESESSIIENEVLDEITKPANKPSLKLVKEDEIKSSITEPINPVVTEKLAEVPLKDNVIDYNKELNSDEDIDNYLSKYVESKIKNEINPVIEDDIESIIEDDIESIIEDDIESIIEDNIEPIIEDDIESIIENDIEPVVESNPKDLNSSIVTDLINEEKRLLEQNKEEEIKKNSTSVISDLRNRMKVKKPTSENSNSSNSSSPSIDVSTLKLKAREAIKAAVKDSVTSKVESDTEKQAVLNVEERLKSLKRKREVLSANGNNILVKEDIDVGDGKVVTNYKSYNVSEEDKNKIEVGKEIETDVVLNENEVLVNGEIYTLTKEEELELIKKYSVREIWVLSDDKYLLEKYNLSLEGSRYLVNLIQSEKDFIMAIRSVDNLIVFTKDIPKVVEKSVAGFLKYLKSEQRKARLVTIEESKINSKMMEYTFEELTIENLDNYYTEFDLNLYREIRKPISELYKQISFDLTSELMENDAIEISVDNLSIKNEGDIELDIDSSRVIVGINNSNNNDIKSKQGDFELKLDDTIVINLEDLK